MCWTAIRSSATGRNGNWKNGRGRDGRRRCAADDAEPLAMVGAGEPGAGAARQPGPPAARGDHLSAAAVRRFPAALAGRPPDRANRRSGGTGRSVTGRLQGCPCRRSCGSRPCCRPACRLSAALAGRMDRGRRRRLGAAAGRGGLLAFFGRETLRNCRRPPCRTCRRWARTPSASWNSWAGAGRRSLRTWPLTAAVTGHVRAALWRWCGAAWSRTIGSTWSARGRMKAEG